MCAVAVHGCAGSEMDSPWTSHGEPAGSSGPTGETGGDTSVGGTGSTSSSSADDESDTGVGPGPGAHTYFEWLVARSDFWKGYSFRPQPGAAIDSVHYENQLLGDDVGGYADHDDPAAGFWITYDPATDDDPQRQDAAKVRIPAFQPPGWPSIATLAADVGVDDESFVLIGGTNAHRVEERAVLVDDEIMTIVDPDGDGPLVAFDEVTGVLHVQRGTFGSVAADHDSGTEAAVAINTVPNPVRVPLGTEDGHTYLFTWDGRWTDSYLDSGLTNHKTFNLLSDGIWFEPNTNFSGNGHESCFDSTIHFAGLHARSYNSVGGPADWSASNGNQLGPGATDNEPVSPRASEFCARTDEWIRFWVRVVHRADDYDVLDFWVATETVDATPLLSEIPVSVRPTSNPPHSIETFYLEYNTSTDHYTRGSRRDLVAYIRNFAVLVDPPEDLAAAGIFERPLPD
jgi:hypothetical protein